MSVTLNQAQLRQALNLLGGDDVSKITIKEMQDGVFAWAAEYPEEGSIRLDESLTVERDAEAELLSHLEAELLSHLEAVDKAFFDIVNELMYSKSHSIDQLKLAFGGEHF